MVSVTDSLSGCRIASSTMRSYHLETRMYNIFPEAARNLKLKNAIHQGLVLSVAAARLGRPQAPDGEPQRVHSTDADQPEEGGEVASHHVCRVVHPEVEPGKADQEHDENSRDGHGPSRPPPLPVSQNEREHSVEADGDGGVAAWERIEGGVVAGVEELGTRPLEYAFQDGGDHGTPSGRDQEEYGGELPASLVEERYDHDPEQQHEPVVAERCDDTHRPVEPAGEGRVDPEQHSPVESAALALDNHVGQPGKGPDNEDRKREPRRKPGGGDHRQAVRDPPDYLFPGLEHGEILTRFSTLAARIISVAYGRSGEGGASSLQNNDIVRALETIATLMEIKDEAYYRVLGYQRAAESVAALGRPAAEVDDLKTLPHVGATTAAVIRDLAEDRTPQLFADLKAEIPEGLVEITHLPSVGPRTVGRLWKELDVTNVEELEALDTERIYSLKGFGRKSAEEVVHAARTYNATERRMLLDEATSLGEQILSFARSHPATERTEVDLRIVEPEAYGSLLHHFTGGQAHNIALRERAVKMGINISEYGLAKAGTGDYKPVATEEDLYSRLGLAYIPPELREDAGEIEAADRGRLPDLLSVEDVRGDLHVHTNYSDGKGTIESMAEAAIELGYEYLVFCDHSQSLRVANGLSPERLKEKIEAVRKADEGYGEIHLLCGSEVDILRDGSLDYDDDVLAGLDFVVASVHTSFGIGEKAMTERIVRAMNNPYVRTIGHPTGRILNRREPYEVDVSRLIQEAAATNTALELNAYVDRLDLAVPYVREAVGAGVSITIDTDAHDERALGFMKYGVSQARRAWVEKGSVINCLPFDEFEKYLKNGK